MNEFNPAPELIRSALISSRNILWNHSAVNVERPLRTAFARLAEVNIRTTSEILEEWIPAALKLLHDGNSQGAAAMLHFVHNLPLDEASLEKWDGKHFLTIELPTFLDNFELAGSPTELLFFALNRIGNR